MHLVFLTDTIVSSKRASAIHVRQLVKVFAELYPKVTLLSQGSNEQHSSLSESGINYDYVHVPKVKGALLVMLLRFGLRVRKKAAEVIYSRFSLISLVIGKVPYAIELHDDAWNKSKLHAFALKRALKQENCLGFVCITESLKKAFEKAYISNKRITVIEDAAQLPVASYTPEWPDKKRLSIAYIGSFFQGKGVELVISSANLLPQHDFVVIGGNKEEISKAQLLVKHDNIDFKGYIEHESIWREMTNIDVCLLPNQPKVTTGKRSDIGRYTSPLKMFEYMSFSKPIIASDLPVLKEVLTDEFCLFAKHDDPNDWQQKIESLASTAVRENLGRKGNSIFLSRYTWLKRAERIKRFLDEQIEAIK